MPEDTSTAQASQDTSAGDGKNTGEAKAGAVTETATSTSQAAQTTDITQTAEFKAALTAAVEKKLPQLRRQIAKEVSGEKEGQPNAEELQRTNGELTTKLRTLEAKETIRDYLSDPKNKVGARQDSQRAIEKLVLAELEYDDDGKPTNVKEAVAVVRSDAPSLFTQAQGSINGGSGEKSVVGFDMNTQIRRAAGRR